MKFQDHQYYNCEITLATGQQYRIEANWMHNNNLDHWKGWSCNAGFHRLDIDKNFDVWSAACHNDYLGNLKTGWSPFGEPTTCKLEQCTGCTDDLIVTKHKNLKG